MDNIPLNDIRIKNPVVSVAIDRLRKRQVSEEPGYDGAYGSIRFFDEAELRK